MRVVAGFILNHVLSRVALYSHYVEYFDVPSPKKQKKGNGVTRSQIGNQNSSVLTS